MDAKVKGTDRESGSGPARPGCELCAREAWALGKRTAHP